LENIRCLDFDKKFSTLVELLGYRALTQPAKIVYAFLDKGEEETDIQTYYNLLYQGSRAIASQLQSLGVTGEQALLASISTRYRLDCCFLWVLVRWGNCSRRISTTPNQSKSISVVSDRIRCRGSVWPNCHIFYDRVKQSLCPASSSCSVAFAGYQSMRTRRLDSSSLAFLQ